MYYVEVADGGGGGLPNWIITGANTVLMESLSVRNDTNTRHKINIGCDSLIGCNFIFESESGDIKIGDRTFINGGTNIICRSKILFGNDVMVAWDCTFYDHNAHSVDWRYRRKDVFQRLTNYNNESPSYLREKNWDVVKASPIIIQDKVWIGFGCTILRGVTIGEGAIVGAQSVVRENVEPWTIVAGNPAVAIKGIRHE